MTEAISQEAVTECLKRAVDSIRSKFPSVQGLHCGEPYIREGEKGKIFWDLSECDKDGQPVGPVLETATVE